MPERHGAVLARVRGSAEQLPDSGRAVAREVLAQPGAIVRASIGTVARAAGVSPASVLRFCHKLGYAGFRDFKIELATEMQGDRFALGTDVTHDDGPRQVAGKVFEADVNAIRETLALLDEGILERAVAALDQAERIEVYGIGSSAPIAWDAHYRFLRIGLRATVRTDAHVQAVGASLLDRRATVLAVSHTGRTRATLDAAHRAREAGATVVGLTSYFGTPLLEACDVAIVTASSETTLDAEAMASRIAHLAVIDALHVLLARRRPDRSLATLDHTHDVIERKRAR